jgi:hypothetical protein
MAWAPFPTVGGIKFWTYQQTTASSQWNIYHGMGVQPMCEVNAHDDNGVLQKAFPLSLIQIDENNVQINWSSPRTGYVSFAAVPA